MTGVILAGGDNRRMNGKMKSFLSFGQGNVLERQISRMKTMCRTLMIVTNQPTLFSCFDQDDAIRIITDDMPGKGPLAGIHAAASRVKEEDLWVVACDMPYISPEAARILWMQQKNGDYDAAIPVIDGITHPLHGIYNRRTAPKLKDVLKSGEYKVRSFLDQIDWIPVGEGHFYSKNINPQFIMNLNTPQEYERALKKRKR